MCFACGRIGLEAEVCSWTSRQIKAAKSRQFNRIRDPSNLEMGLDVGTPIVLNCSCGRDRGYIALWENTEKYSCCDPLWYHIIVVEWSAIVILRPMLQLRTAI